MKTIQLELNHEEIKKGQSLSVFFEENISDYAKAQENAWQNQREEKTLSMPHGICLDKKNAINLNIGTSLQIKGRPFFKVIDKVFTPFSCRPSYILECLCDLPNTDASDTSNSQENNSSDIVSPRLLGKSSYDFECIDGSYNLAIITLSDKGSIGERIDESAPALSKIITSKIQFTEKRYFILPDNANVLKGLVATLAYQQNFHCIITTGGTGLSERDVTPNALLPMLDQRLHGFEHAMMQKSLEKTPTAMLSRAFCGIINKSLLIAVPGSVKASTENLEAILPALPHALEKLAGDMSDCARK